MSSGKWVYLVLDLNDRLAPAGFDANGLENHLSHYGDEGWELVAVDKGIAYLKRPGSYEDREEEG